MRNSNFEKWKNEFTKEEEGEREKNGKKCNLFDMVKVALHLFIESEDKFTFSQNFWRLYWFSGSLIFLFECTSAMAVEFRNSLRILRRKKKPKTKIVRKVHFRVLHGREATTALWINIGISFTSRQKYKKKRKKHEFENGFLGPSSRFHSFEWDAKD